MNWDFVNKAPPWLVVLAIGLMVVMYNTSVKPIMEKVESTLEKIVDKIEVQERKINSHSWRLDNHTDRLNGLSVKNREQDGEIRNLDRVVTRLSIINGRDANP